MFLELILGQSGRDANPLVTLIRCTVRLDKKRYSFPRFVFDGTCLQALEAGAAHILTLARSSALDCYRKHAGARFIILIDEGVFLIVVQD